MNKFALVTLAALPGQGSGVAAYRAPEVWKAAEKKVEVALVFEHTKTFPTLDEWLDAKDPYAEVKAAFAEFGRGAIEVGFWNGVWEPWNINDTPSWNAPPEQYRVSAWGHAQYNLKHPFENI